MRAYYELFPRALLTFTTYQLVGSSNEMFCQCSKRNPRYRLSRVRGISQPDNFPIKRLVNRCHYRMPLMSLSDLSTSVCFGANIFGLPFQNL